MIVLIFGASVAVALIVFTGSGLAGSERSTLIKWALVGGIAGLAFGVVIGLALRQRIRRGIRVPATSLGIGPAVAGALVLSAYGSSAIRGAILAVLAGAMSALAAFAHEWFGSV